MNPTLKPSSNAVVYLVGAGPGDPGLITLRAAELLCAADVVLFDYLVNPVIAAHANGRAELICLGRHGHGRIWSQREINEKMVSAARQGQTVVRLKGGDPAVFGRLAEEASYLAAHSVAFEIVPGVTAASAATAYAGILLTSSQSASAVAFVTGQQLREKRDQALDFDALARFPGSLVIYMGVTTAERWVTALIRGGKPADTPVALIRRCSFSDQRVQRCGLAEVPQALTPYSKFAPPVVAVIGEIVNEQLAIDWFFRRPLLSTTVLVTRPRGQSASMSASMSAAITNLGGCVLHQPAISILPADDQITLRAAVQQAKEYDWIVFSSANGVRFFLAALFDTGRDARHLGSCRLAAIGAATADALRPFGLTADAVPSSYRAEALAERLRNEVSGRSVLLVRASRGREVLAETLRTVARELRQVVAYQSLDLQTADEHVLEALDAGSVDWTTVTSSAIAKSLVRMLGERLRKTKLVSISPVTSTTLAELGFPPYAEATEYTWQGVIDAILAQN